MHKTWNEFSFGFSALSFIFQKSCPFKFLCVGVGWSVEVTVPNLQCVSAKSGFFSYSIYSMILTSNLKPKVSFEILWLWAFQNCPWLPDLANYGLRKSNLKKGGKSGPSLSCPKQHMILRFLSLFLQFSQLIVYQIKQLTIKGSFGKLSDSGFQNWPWVWNLMKDSFKNFKVKKLYEFF